MYRAKIGYTERFWLSYHGGRIDELSDTKRR
jgi:hypothetical protein